ncbi:hypothetical protein EYF80_018498 [Liparis tanakae]|uniref:Uncharacterized protein n=1 Tax=Liparis tanakae TaxID=230148 RepID=A0A4Z2HZT9_9TELE|nr:hypothetical protein EYF80_018498 [Liparis tanakae]
MTCFYVELEHIRSHSEFYTLMITLPSAIKYTHAHTHYTSTPFDRKQKTTSSHIKVTCSPSLSQAAPEQGMWESTQLSPHGTVFT